MPVVLTPNITIGEAVAVSVAGQLMFCKGGKVDRKAVAVKVTNARSGGFAQNKGGTRSADLSLELVYNGDSPPTIVEGTEVTVIFDSVGYETSEGLANPVTTTTPAPAGRLITGQFLVTGVGDAWQCEADYGITITAISTGPYTVADTATGATPTT